MKVLTPKKLMTRQREILREFSALENGRVSAGRKGFMGTMKDMLGRNSYYRQL